MVLVKLHVYGRKSETKKPSLPTSMADSRSHIHPSLWFIAEGPLVQHQWIPPFDHCLRSDEWTARLHDHQILGYVGVYVDDLLIAGPQISQ